MNCQMMRVISSPSSSTTGLATLIFGINGAFHRWKARGSRGEGSPPYSKGQGAAPTGGGAPFEARASRAQAIAAVIAATTTHWMAVKAVSIAM